MKWSSHISWDLPFVGLRWCSELEEVCLLKWRGVSCTPRDGRCVGNTRLGGVCDTQKLSSVWLTLTMFVCNTHK